MSREVIQLVNKKNLTIARENVGYTTREVTDRVCGKQTKTDRVKEWEAGKGNLTWKQLEKMAKAYDINMFLLTSNDNLTPCRDIEDFRKLDDGVNKARVKKFLCLLLKRQRFLEYTMKEDKSAKNALVGSGSRYRDNPERLAEFISKKVGYRAEDVANERYPVKYFVSLVERQDIFVMKTLASNPIEVKEMRGVYLSSKYAPIIAINRRDTKTAQMFTLAHELAHLFIDVEGITNMDFRATSVNDRTEIFCNKVASYLLLPNRVLEDKKCSLQSVIDVADRYKVNELFTFYRLKDAGRIRKSDAVGFEKTILQRMRGGLEEKKMTNRERGKGGSRGHTNNMKDTNGDLFNTFISSLYLEGRLNAVEASKALKMFVEEVV